MEKLPHSPLEPDRAATKSALRYSPTGKVGAENGASSVALLDAVEAAATHGTRWLKVGWQQSTSYQVGWMKLEGQLPLWWSELAAVGRMKLVAVTSYLVAVGSSWSTSSFTILVTIFRWVDSTMNQLSFHCQKTSTCSSIQWTELSTYMQVFQASLLDHMGLSIKNSCGNSSLVHHN